MECISSNFITNPRFCTFRIGWNNKFVSFDPKIFKLWNQISILLRSILFLSAIFYSTLFDFENNKNKGIRTHLSKIYRHLIYAPLLSKTNFTSHTSSIASILYRKCGLEIDIKNIRCI